MLLAYSVRNCSSITMLAVSLTPAHASAAGSDGRLPELRKLPERDTRNRNSPSAKFGSWSRPPP
jgi:hypothetical protein